MGRAHHAWAPRTAYVAAIALLLLGPTGCETTLDPEPTVQRMLVKQGLTIVTNDWEYRFPHAVVIDGEGGLASGELVVSVYNVGQRDLRVTAIELLSGDIGDFSLAWPGPEHLVESLRSIECSIRFDPSADLGLRSADILITSDDPGEPTQTFAVSGYGVRKLATEGNPEAVEWDVAISGDTAVVAVKDSAQVFYRDRDGPDTWGPVKELTVIGAGRLAIDGDVISVSSGNRIYLFYRDAGGTDNWGAGLIEGIYVGDAWSDGPRVAICGDTLVAGAPEGGTWREGYVRVYTYAGGGVWGLVKELTASDGGIQCFFGSEAALSGDTILTIQYGSAYVDGAHGVYFFSRDHGGTNNWGQVKKITPDDVAAGDDSGYFGGVLALDGDVAVVGCFTRHNVYLFSRNHGGIDNWGLTKTITLEEGVALSVALSGDTLAVGAAWLVYVYSRDLGGADHWGLVSQVRLEPSGMFGQEVAVAGETVLVGAPSSTYSWNDGETHHDDVISGAAYIWKP